MQLWSSKDLKEKVYNVSKGTAHQFLTRFFKRSNKEVHAQNLKIFYCVVLGIIPFLGEPKWIHSFFRTFLARGQSLYLFFHCLTLMLNDRDRHNLLYRGLQAICHKHQRKLKKRWCLRLSCRATAWTTTCGMTVGINTWKETCDMRVPF